MQYHFHPYKKETLLLLWRSLCNAQGCRSTATDLLKGGGLCYEFRKQSSFLHIRTTASDHTTDHSMASILALAVSIFGKSIKQCLPKMLLNGNNSCFRELECLFFFFKLKIQKLVFLYLTVCNRAFRLESEHLLLQLVQIFKISNIL